ncbi:hypothetical protein J1N35_009916 [Gossypium stocksii]|uniref:Uncharacterized protein n=1 Tax=Gossypium stocksii TaxID=47602 RepID=A0A9D3W117_9ROSI|nr:hypothetical protein J1N35_009916 [Gossypium stocksii]
MNKWVERMVHVVSLPEESKSVYFIGSNYMGGSKPRAWTLHYPKIWRNIPLLRRPLLRDPILAGTSDDPSFGPYILTFKDLPSWVAAYKSCKSKIIFQCEEGTITTSNKCKPAWWQSLIGWKSMDLTERERCEDIEIGACSVEAKEKCIDFAKVMCMTPFLNTRIVMWEKEIMNKRVERTVHAASLPEESKWVYFIRSNYLGGSEPKVTNSRAS